MQRYQLEAKIFAAALAAVAGYVDAVGFLETRGYFVSFMSGNSTRVAVGLAEGSSAAILGVELIAAFVAGVVCGSMLGRLAHDRRATAILLFVAAMLAAATSVAALHHDYWGVVLLAAAMGAENTVFTEDGEVRIGVTYMTGTLVKLGKAISAALAGGATLGWLPFLGLWLGLVAGASLGAVAFARLGVAALWIAAAATSLLAVMASRVRLT